jgi:hypothetical protein
VTQMKRCRKKMECIVAYGSIDVLHVELIEQILCFVVQGDENPLYTHFTTLATTCKQWEELLPSIERSVVRHMTTQFWSFVNNHPKGRSSREGCNGRDYIRRDIIGLDCFQKGGCYGHSLNVNLYNLATAKFIVGMLPIFGGGGDGDEKHLPQMETKEMFHVMRASTRLPALFIASRNKMVSNGPPLSSHLSYLFIETVYNDAFIMLPLWELREQLAGSNKNGGSRVLKSTTYKNLRLRKDGSLLVPPNYKRTISTIIDLNDMHSTSSFYSLSEEDRKNCLHNFDTDELKEPHSILYTTKISVGKLTQQLDVINPLIVSDLTTCYNFFLLLRDHLLEVGAESAFVRSIHLFTGRKCHFCSQDIKSRGRHVTCQKKESRNDGILGGII